MPLSISHWRNWLSNSNGTVQKTTGKLLFPKKQVNNNKFVASDRGKKTFFIFFYQLNDSSMRTDIYLFCHFKLVLSADQGRLFNERDDEW